MTQDTRIPTEYERKQVFYWLKKVSSYTAWQRIYGFYQRWADLVEKNVRHCESQPIPSGAAFSAMPTSRLTFVLKGLANFETALQRLKKGDKSIFEFGPRGYLEMAGSPVSYWNTATWKWEDGEIELRVAEIPFWNEMTQALKDLTDAWRECAPYCMEERYEDTPVYMEMNDFHRDVFSRATFPDPLPDVPIPKRHVFVKTGQITPYSGIWEPVVLEEYGGFLGFYKSRVIPDSGHFPLTGTMNYLHAWSKAPKQPTAQREGAPAVWHLLWEDDRYRDGTIPEEESGYVFNEPQRKETPVQSTADMLLQHSGESCRRSGVWVRVNLPEISQIIRIGQEIPFVHGTRVGWMWMRNE